MKEKNLNGHIVKSLKVNSDHIWLKPQYEFKNEKADVDLTKSRTCKHMTKRKNGSSYYASNYSSTESSDQEAGTDRRTRKHCRQRMSFHEDDSLEKSSDTYFNCSSAGGSSQKSQRSTRKTNNVMVQHECVEYPAKRFHLEATNSRPKSVYSDVSKSDIGSDYSDLMADSEWESDSKIWNIPDSDQSDDFIFTGNMMKPPTASETVISHRIVTEFRSETEILNFRADSEYDMASDEEPDTLLMFSDCESSELPSDSEDSVYADMRVEIYDSFYDSQSKISLKESIDNFQDAQIITNAAKTTDPIEEKFHDTLSEAFEERDNSLKKYNENIQNAMAVENSQNIEKRIDIGLSEDEFQDSVCEIVSEKDSTVTCQEVKKESEINIPIKPIISKMHVLIVSKNKMIDRMAQKLKLNLKGMKWDFLWSDAMVPLRMWRTLRPWQSVNQLPGMDVMSNKVTLTKILNRKANAFPDDYNFYPITWIVPEDIKHVFYFQKKAPSDVTFIVKPARGSCGSGIRLVKEPSNIHCFTDAICQIYIQNPLLIGGFKFDFRTYVLITNLKPLCIFHYNDGLARFATVPYRSPEILNQHNRYMHLTNTSINSLAPKLPKSFSRVYLRKISTVNKIFEQRGYNVSQIWNNVDDAVVKTIIAALPSLSFSYEEAVKKERTLCSAGCQILGFDILLDRNLKVYVLEVNDYPSLATSHHIEKEVKENLIMDTMVLLNLHCLPHCRKIVKNVDESTSWGSCCSSSESLEILKHSLTGLTEHKGNYRRIYPCKNKEKYDKFFTALEEDIIKPVPRNPSYYRPVPLNRPFLPKTQTKSSSNIVNKSSIGLSNKLKSSQIIKKKPGKNILVNFKKTYKHKLSSDHSQRQMVKMEPRSKEPCSKESRLKEPCSKEFNLVKPSSLNWFNPVPKLRNVPKKMPSEFISPKAKGEKR